jgi:hypothetical protein
MRTSSSRRSRYEISTLMSACNDRLTGASSRSRRRSNGEQGLCVYSIEDDTVRGALTEGIALAAWSPDGMHIASLMFRGGGINAPADAWVIDASELVGGTA